jgi:tetrahydromethanopterin S-methyltransferase subunit B
MMNGLSFFYGLCVGIIITSTFATVLVKRVFKNLKER